VITGVAQRSMRRLRHLVYLDAAVPLPGESWSSLHDEATRTAGARPSPRTARWHHPIRRSTG
jgi:hypothetical protein